MEKLVCSVRKDVITLIKEDNTVKKLLNNRIQTYTPNNTFHFGKRCFPINFYLKNGKYDADMSAGRKRKLSKLDMLALKGKAINNLLTKLDLNLVK